MKSFSKISSVVTAAAMAAAFSISVSRADDIVVKPQRYQGPAKSVFTAKATRATAMNCSACTETLKSVVTQDSKLKTKPVVASEHACKECKTIVTRTGAHKATVKDVKLHTCGAMLAAVENCCGGAK